jgi:hypothetical protein
MEVRHVLAIRAPVDLLNGILVALEDMVVGALVLNLPQD